MINFILSVDHGVGTKDYGKKSVSLVPWNLFTDRDSDFVLVDPVGYYGLLFLHDS